MSFDHLAPHYRWLERITAGNILQRARLAHLPALDLSANILLVGEGPGRFLGALRARRPDVPITVIDSSSRMLDVAQKISSGPTTFEQLDLTETSLPADQWDAVVSHCFLDCFAPVTLDRVVANIAQATTSQANWLITDFAVPSQGWQRARARLIHSLMYRTFRLGAHLEAHHWTDPAPLLTTHSFSLIARKHFNHGLIRADHWRRE